MQGVANISILAMFVMYLLTAIFGYLTFYGKMPSAPQRSEVALICRHDFFSERATCVRIPWSYFPAYVNELWADRVTHSVCLFVERWRGVGAAAHVQPRGLERRPHSVRASGRAGGRHVDCSRGAVSGKIFIHHRHKRGLSRQMEKRWPLVVETRMRLLVLKFLKVILDFYLFNTAFENFVSLLFLITFSSFILRSQH